MKRLIACALLLAMLITLFAGCNTSANIENSEPTESVDTSALDSAVEYLKSIYKDAEESTPVDYQRVATVRIGTQAFTVAWSVDVSEDLIKITESNGMATIAVSDSNPEDVPYVLTATVSDSNGNSKSLTWNHYLPAAIVGDFSAILDMAYALESGESMDNSCTLTGIITSINTAWSDDYQNITVTIVMEGCEDRPVMCYRLKGDGAKDLEPGDQITVTGTIKNYNGTVEFDAGCTLDAVVKGVGTTVKAPEDPAEIMDAAYALAEGESLPYTATITGEIVSVDTAWSSQYNNITVTIAVEGDNRTIKCFRLKGEGAEELWKEDIITVTGTIKNYYGEIEFDAGCQLVDCIPGSRYHGKLPDQPDDPLQIIEDAYNLTVDSNLPYNVRISGYVTSVISPWSDTYHNITVNIAIPGAEDKPIQCYRMHGSENGANTIQVGDYITVFGSIKNYNGTVEFYAGCHCEKVVKGDGSLPWGSKDPAADSTLTVKEAYDLGNSKSHNEYTTGKYYVTGVIKDVYSDVYGNMHIQDTEGNELTVYGTYSADGSTRYDKMDPKPVAGDTITVYGIIGKFSSTPQMKNAWIVKHTPAGGSETPVEPTEPSVEPTEPIDPEPTEPSTPADPSTLSIADAIAKAKSMGNTYTTEKYYVTGKISKITSTTYGNMAIEDSSGNSLFIYGTYSADGSTAYGSMTTKPVVGDTITVYGVLGCYNGSAQMKNGWIVAHTPAATTPTEPDESGDVPTASSSLEEILAYCKTMDVGTYLSFQTTITNTITWTSSYSSTYNNITVNMDIGSFNVQCYCMKGTGIDQIALGDTITVTGYLGKNSKGNIAFKEGCTLVSWVDNT